MVKGTEDEAWFVPDPQKIHFRTDVKFDRPGVDRTVLLFSYSGAMLIEGKLCPVWGHVNGHRFVVEIPTRVAAPSRRPTPQLDFENVQRFFKVDLPPSFPLQINTFHGLTQDGSAGANVWFGPNLETTHAPPQDSLSVVYFGPDSMNEGPTIERYLIKPFFEWIRVLTRQWWAGRSTEGADGGLHFIAPLDEAGAIVGSPTPYVRFLTASAGMQPVTMDNWKLAWERVFQQYEPPADKALEMDANFAIASSDFRSGIILACSSIEAARDALLTRLRQRISDMRTSKTDLLKHLSVGLDNVVGLNLRRDRPDLYSFATAFWIARGEAAHGKPVRWRLNGEDRPIADVEFATISHNLASLLAWLDSVAPAPELR